MNPRTWKLALICIALVATSALAQTDKRKTTAPSKQQLSYQPLNVKVGLWETTVTYKTSGSLSVPSGMLENLTPEQRARLEARMNASQGGAKTYKHQHCVTQEELEKPIDFSEKNCTWKIDESTSTRDSGSVSCTESGMVLEGKGTFEAPDPEHITGSQHMTASGGDTPMTVDGTFTSTWLGATCGNVR